MNDSKLLQLVTAAVALDRQIAQLQERQKQYKADLVAEAASRTDEHEKTEGGGSSIAFTGADGCIARITFPARTLKGQLDAEAKGFAKIKELAGKAFSRLFIPAIVYKPAINFREVVAAELPAADARSLIKKCESDSSPRVSFETKEAAQKAA